MRQAPWLLVFFLLTGCSFVTSSRIPLFSPSDFVVPVRPGLYVAEDGTRVRLGVSGKRLLVRLTEANGKVSDMVGGAVPTQVPDYYVLQLVPTDVSARKVAYLPVRVRGTTIWVLLRPADNDPVCDAVFLRHGFAPGNLGWSHPEPLARADLVAFYHDLLAVIAGDRRWSGNGSPTPYKAVVFRMASSD